MMPLYQQSGFQQLTGSSLRPGGTALTGRALDLAAFAPGVAIVDVGCGPGTSLALLCERGYRAVGVDISLAMLEIARKRASAAHLATGSATKLPLESATMDGVLCECVLSLLPAPQAALAECHRVLKKGGKLIWADMCLPDKPLADKPLPDKPLAEMQGKTPQEIQKNQALGSEKMQTCLQGACSVAAMRQSLEQAGFTVLHCEEKRRAVVELAAQMLWQNVSCACPASLSASFSGATNGASYVFFIAQKVVE